MDREPALTPHRDGHDGPGERATFTYICALTVTTESCLSGAAIRASVRHPSSPGRIKVPSLSCGEIAISLPEARREKGARTRFAEYCGRCLLATRHDQPNRSTALVGVWRGRSLSPLILFAGSNWPEVAGAMMCVLCCPAPVGSGAWSPSRVLSIATSADMVAGPFIRPRAAANAVSFHHLSLLPFSSTPGSWMGIGSKIKLVLFAKCSSVLHTHYVCSLPGGQQTKQMVQGPFCLVPK